MAETPGVPNAELARKTFLTPQSVNEVLKHLEASEVGGTSADSVKCESSRLT
jgi:Winged helix-turn-helix DNA-binding